MHADVEHRDDAGVIQRRGQPGFALQPRDGGLVVAQIPGDELDRHEAAQPRIARAIHLSHTAGTDGFQDLVGSDAEAWMREHVRGTRRWSIGYLKLDCSSRDSVTSSPSSATGTSSVFSRQAAAVERATVVLRLWPQDMHAGFDLRPMRDTSHDGLHHLLRQRPALAVAKDPRCTQMARARVFSEKITQRFRGQCTNLLRGVRLRITHVGDERAFRAAEIATGPLDKRGVRIEVRSRFNELRAGGADTLSQHCVR